MADVAMPRLSDSMEEGTILKWLKSDGDEVKRGEELVEIETDKANMTYEADQEGVLKIVAGGEQEAPAEAPEESDGEAEAPSRDEARSDVPKPEDSAPEREREDEGAPVATAQPDREPE